MLHNLRVIAEDTLAAGPHAAEPGAQGRAVTGSGQDGDGSMQAWRRRKRAAASAPKASGPEAEGAAAEARAAAEALRESVHTAYGRAVTRMVDTAASQVVEYEAKAPALAPPPPPPVQKPRAPVWPASSLPAPWAAADARSLAPPPPPPPPPPRMPRPADSALTANDVITSPPRAPPLTPAASGAGGLYGAPSGSAWPQASWRTSSSGAAPSFTSHDHDEPGSPRSAASHHFARGLAARDEERLRSRANSQQLGSGLSGIQEGRESWFGSAGVQPPQAGFDAQSHMQLLGLLAAADGAAGSLQHVPGGDPGGRGAGYGMQMSSGPSGQGPAAQMAGLLSSHSGSGGLYPRRSDGSALALTDDFYAGWSAAVAGLPVGAQQSGLAGLLQQQPVHTARSRREAQRCPTTDLAQRMMHLEQAAQQQQHHQQQLRLQQQLSMQLLRQQQEQNLLAAALLGAQGPMLGPGFEQQAAGLSLGAQALSGVPGFLGMYGL